MISSVGDTDSTSIPPPKYLPAEYLDENIQVEEELEIFAATKGYKRVQEDGFRLDYDHDIALVNKHLDWLKDDYKIPGQWWRNENRKYMVQMDNGHWKFF
ncbi:hypothetical protein J1N35_031122 [Gossypium stocksii]|uniref:Phospholipase A1 n=1 Tax=Gossypium stocksii TaxID=47602 RepID=A0A9D3V0I9_9ROSI|nr:hypothetical protein J1N35_031122 [Gossypium stocksii]